MLKFSISLAAILTSVFLTGCHLPSTQKDIDSKGTSSTFFLDDIKGEFNSESFIKEISIPKTRSYAIKACLKDLKYSKGILEHPFKIEELNLELKTDTTGCLNWMEIVEFDFLMDPTFITLGRTIISNGIHRGSIAVKFAVNPWDLETHRSIINLDKISPTPLLTEAESLLKLKGHEEALKKIELWVEDGRLFVNEEKLGIPFQLKYEFNLTPTLKMKKTSQEPTLYNLKFGKFAGKIEVIQNFFDGNTDKNKFEVLAENVFSDATLDKGMLAFSKVLEFSLPPSRGNLFLRLFLKPQSDLKNIKPFVGIYPLGEANNLRNNQFLKILRTPELTEKIDKAIPVNWSKVDRIKVSSSDEFAAGSTDSSKADSIISVLPLSVTPQRGDKINYHTRTMIYNVETCVTNNLTKLPLNFQDFTITAFSTDESKPGHIIKVKSNVGGCMFWTDSIEYNIYECHHFFKGYIILENKHLNIKMKRYYNVNPWSNYFVAIDDTKVSDPSALVNRCEGPTALRSELEIDSLSFKFINISYDKSISPLLEWNLKKNYGLELFPKVKIPSHLEEGVKHDLEPLIDGYYLLRLNILKSIPISKKLEVIFYKDMLVSLNKGRIYAPIEINFQDQRFFSTRNSVFVQLLPIKQDRVKETQPYTVVKLNTNDSFESLVDPESKLISPIFSEDFAFDSENPMARLKTFSKTFLNEHKNSQNINDTIDFEQLRTEFKKKQLLRQKQVSELSKLEKFVTINALSSVSTKNFKFGTSVQKILKTKKVEGDKIFLNELCQYWFANIWNGKFNMSGEYLLKRACRKAADTGVKSFFEFNHIYQIHSIKESDKIGIGPEKTLSIANSFMISTASTDFITGQLGLSTKLGSKAGYTSPGKEFFPSVGAEWGVEVAAQLAKGTQRSFTESNGITLSETTSLHVNETQFKIQPESYTYCISIKPNPRLFTPSGKMILFELWDGDIDYSRFFKSAVSEQEKMLLLKKGFLFCNTAPESKSTQFIEQYYWIYQSLDCTETQDCKEDKNKVFNLMIRGNQDYERFKYFLTKNWAKPISSAQSKSDLEKYANQIKLLENFNKTLPGFYMYREQ